jgi:protein-tyrosine phosphatase
MRNVVDRRKVADRSVLPSQAAGQFVDLHCHCLPNLDDGPKSMTEAVALCEALAHDKVGCVVATPHQLGRYEGSTDAEQIRRTVRRLNQELADKGVDLEVLTGAEVRLDERISELLACDRVLTLADRKRHLLLEFPDEVFIDVEPLLLQLQSEGIDVIIAHPERNVSLLRQPGALQRWLCCGASLQVTSASLTGCFGRGPKNAAWTLVAQGWAATVATDAHNPNSDRSYMSVVFEMIANHIGRDLAHLLCIENPSRVVRGESLISVFSSDRQEVW